MGVETVIAIGRSALELTLTLAGPVLVFGLAAGLAVSIFQALTQINEITLTFIPKIAATAAALALFGPWMLTRLISFTVTLFQSLPAYVRGAEGHELPDPRPDGLPARARARGGPRRCVADLRPPDRPGARAGRAGARAR